MRQILFSTLFLMATVTLFAQNNTQFINQELKNLEVKLVKKGESYKLTNQQVLTLTKLFEDKGQRVELLKSKISQKDELSVALLKLEEEFSPRVNAILNKDQRLALQNTKAKKLN